MATADWWDDPAYDELAQAEGEDGSDTDTERGPTPAEGVKNVVELLVHWKMRGILTAKQLCAFPKPASE